MYINPSLLFPAHTWTTHTLWLSTPLPLQAVCCEDHQHCCPQGYTCNMKTGTCDKKDKNVLTHTLHQIKVVQPQSQFSEDDVGVPCDSTGDLQCSKSETCCKTSPSGWACCPSPQVSVHHWPLYLCFFFFLQSNDDKMWAIPFSTTRVIHHYTTSSLCFRPSAAPTLSTAALQDSPVTRGQQAAAG